MLFFVENLIKNKTSFVANASADLNTFKGELRSRDKTQFSWIEINKCKQVTPFFPKLKSRKVFIEECAEKDGLKVVLKLLAGCCRSELTHYN